MDSWQIEPSTDELLEGAWKNRLRYFKREMKGYFCHLFVIRFDGEEQLAAIYEDITEQIAAYFQVNLEVDVEVWNIYLVFAVDSEVNKDLKYKVEQDKYSSRKLVFDNLSQCSDEQMQAHLDKQIFKIDTRNFTVLTDEIISVSTSIKEEDQKLYEVLKKFRIGQHMESIHEKYLNGFENG